jgi:hypothetical protein
VASRAAALPGACALAGVAAACGVRSWAPPPRRVIVYVAALASAGLVSYASIAWSLTPQASWGDANRWLVAAAAAAAGTLLAALLRRPLEAAVWVLCTASLPFIAYGIQQRAHGEFFQTSPRLQGALGYPNAIGAYAALAAPGPCGSARRSARRVAGCGCCRCSCSLASPPRAAGAGGSDRLRGLAGGLQSGAPRAALSPCSPRLRRRLAGASTSRPSALDALHGPAGSHVVWYAAAAVLACSGRAPGRGTRAGPPDHACAAPAGLTVLVIGGGVPARGRAASRYGGPGGAISHVWRQLSRRGRSAPRI